MLYITNDNGINLWDSLPIYWDELVTQLAQPQANYDGISNVLDNCALQANTTQQDHDWLGGCL